MTTAPLTDQRRLLDLQALDTQIAKIGHQRRSLPVLATLAELEGRAEDLHRAQVEAKTLVSDTRREVAKAEADVEQVRSRARRHQQLLDSGTGTSKDLQALQTELGQLAARQEVLEEIELEAMERLESAEQTVADLQTQQDAIVADVESGTAERDRAFAELDERLAQLRAERDALAGQIDAELLDLYEDVRSRTGGLGAVALHGTRTEPVSLDLSLTELDAVRSAAPDDVVVSEDYGYILVQMDRDA
ncbi:hypothetical protein PU560_07305 [Georgenia sp. 10Sc9-8]|uniref:CT398-like coiled coil hairpin domain-containing protein n=1 Tax=Georgenia halotolerans TaxID=3028317 RepID=A0ABT5TZG5_9MICO|nr:hypothetical protein [Georgenia halotolerans]